MQSSDYQPERFPYTFIRNLPFFVYTSHLPNKTTIGRLSVVLESEIQAGHNRQLLSLEVRGGILGIAVHVATNYL